MASVVLLDDDRIHKPAPTAIAKQLSARFIRVRAAFRFVRLKLRARAASLGAKNERRHAHCEAESSPWMWTPKFSES
jgi:hypothetical protein